MGLHRIRSSSRTVGPYRTESNPLAVIHTRLDYSDHQTEGVHTNLRIEGVHTATNHSIISQGGIQAWGLGTFGVNRGRSQFMGLDSRMLKILSFQYL